jgi:hypothetical protein
MEHDDIIDTEQLRAFEAVAVSGSFTRAAAVLGTAQSSVSQQVARLEKRAGQLLIRGTTRRVELTPSGVSMLVYVRSILAMADDARRRLGAPHGRYPAGDRESDVPQTDCIEAGPSPIGIRTSPIGIRIRIFRGKTVSSGVFWSLPGVHAGAGML